MKRIVILVMLKLSAVLTAAGLVSERTEYVSEMTVGKRPRTAAHTQIYSRIQPYQLYGDYTRQWHDRGLFHSNALRKTRNPQLESFLTEMKSLKEYDIAGILPLSNAHPDYYFRLLKLLAGSGTKPEVPVLVLHGDRVFLDLDGHTVVFPNVVRFLF